METRPTDYQYVVRFGTPNLNESSPGPSWFVVGQFIARHLQREYKIVFILQTQQSTDNMVKYQDVIDTVI